MVINYDISKMPIKLDNNRSGSFGDYLSNKTITQTETSRKHKSSHSSDGYESDIEERSCFVTSDASDKIILLLKLLKLHFHYLNNE